MPTSDISCVLSDILPNSYIQNLSEYQRNILNYPPLFNLLSSRRLPEYGISQESITHILSIISALDSNNEIDSVGVGEREGRVISPLIRSRYFGLFHGIGRSGSLDALQPKAIGSTLLFRISVYLLSDALRISGFHFLSRKPKKRLCFLPVCTGMALSLIILELKKKNSRFNINTIHRESVNESIENNILEMMPQKSVKRDLVIWSRMDQKSFIQAAELADVRVVPIEQIFDSSLKSLVTDLDGIESVIRIEMNYVLCVVLTTSCFAPRSPDLVYEVSKMCATYDIPLIVNNAYGLHDIYLASQLERCVNHTYDYLKNSIKQDDKGARCQIKEGYSDHTRYSSCEATRIDAIVMSTDKNLMVPVGGAFIVGMNESLIQGVNASYPGRASCGPAIDVFCSLLHMGTSSYTNLLDHRREIFDLVFQSLNEDTKEQSISYTKTEIGKLGDNVCNESSLENVISTTNNPTHQIDEIATSYSVKLNRNCQDITVNEDIRNLLSHLRTSYMMEMIRSHKNYISIALDLTYVRMNLKYGISVHSIGGMIYNHKVTGSRVVCVSEESKSITVCKGHSYEKRLENFGLHISREKALSMGIDSYITFAISIGVTYKEVRRFLLILSDILRRNCAIQNSV